jgi:hypothetical protein
MSCAPAPPRPIEAIEGPLTNRSRDAVLPAYHSIHPRRPRYLSVTPDPFERQLVALARDGYGAGRLGISSASARIVVLRPWRPHLRRRVPRQLRGCWPCMRSRATPGSSASSPAASTRASSMARPAAIRGSARGCHDSYELAHGRGAQRGGNAVRQPHADAPAPPTLTDDELAQELLESRRRLQAPLGRCDAVAYPFGDWDSRTAAAAAGYRSPSRFRRCRTPR